MSPFDTWLLIGEVVALLVLFWLVCNWTFDLIARRYDELKAADPGEDVQANKERVV